MDDSHASSRRDGRSRGGGEAEASPRRATACLRPLGHVTRDTIVDPEVPAKASAVGAFAGGVIHTAVRKVSHASGDACKKRSASWAPCCVARRVW